MHMRCNRGELHVMRGSVGPVQVCSFLRQLSITSVAQRIKVPLNMAYVAQRVNGGV